MSRVNEDYWKLREAMYYIESMLQFTSDPDALMALAKARLTLKETDLARIDKVEEKV